MKKSNLLFLTILIEGYVVLACELLAIRQTIPFVGSGIETTAIIISAVLLPLAVGYHFGGRAYAACFAKAQAGKFNFPSVRKILIRNMIISLCFLVFGLFYASLEVFFASFHSIGITHRLIQAGIYSVLFLVTPMFLLAQTVPLISNYFSQQKLSEITGKMLFFSTAGSFLGSIFSTLVLMTYIGVNNTIFITLGLLCFLIWLLSRKNDRYTALYAAVLLISAYMLNANVLGITNTVSDNAYNIVQLKQIPDEDSLILRINRSNSSKYNEDREQFFDYIKYIEKTFIAPLAKAKDRPGEILIIGAGGFTLGIDDQKNNFTFVDIDPALKDVSEKHFLKDKLSPNKKFIAASAREFVHNNDKSFDLIVIDVFTNSVSIPMECVTREFLQDVKKRLREDGMVVVNLIADPAFRDKFTVRYDRTFASVFPVYSRQVIFRYNPWEKEVEDNVFSNIIYSASLAALDEKAIYTDDKNTYSLDRP